MSDYIVIHGTRIAKDFIPETFGRLTTIGPRFMLPYGTQGKKAPAQVCQCSCNGGYTVTRVSSLKTGLAKSCGCLLKEKTAAIGRMNKKHGMYGTTEYKSWQGMKSRCNNNRHHAYSDYGGRGISVHPDWDNPENGFQKFYDYMGPKPTPEHEIERDNVNGNYEPGNVRWATVDEQARNKRNNVSVTYNGKTQCLAAWAEELGIKDGTLRDRLQRGWSVEKALTIRKKGGAQ